mmetsp:Transcript_19361/g.22862  ORF Transcript_19361/g.22862 Transcript_19361/m.22862 type:complete len:81 (+) Transcript_19361:88-330(+)
MVKQNESLRFQVKQLLSTQTNKKKQSVQPPSVSTPQHLTGPGKKVKGERYSQDQAYLLDKLNRPADPISDIPTQAATAKL